MSANTEALRSANSVVSVSVNTETTVCSLSLPPGDWEVDCIVYYVGIGTTLNYIQASVGVGAPTRDVGVGGFVSQYVHILPAGVHTSVKGMPKCVCTWREYNGLSDGLCGLRRRYGFGLRQSDRAPRALIPRPLRLAM